MDDVTEHSGRDDTVLVGLLQDALQDVSEQYARGMNNLLWTNGAADAKALAGMAALITDDPTTGIVAGINRAQKPWWRNRAYTTAMGTAVTGTPALGAWGGGPITSATTNGGALITKLQTEYRQLTKYGAKPNTGVLRIRLARRSGDRAARQRQLLDAGLRQRQGRVASVRSPTWEPTSSTIRRWTRSANRSVATGTTPATSTWSPCRTSGATSIHPSARRTST